MPWRHLSSRKEKDFADQLRAVLCAKFRERPELPSTSPKSKRVFDQTILRAHALFSFHTGLLAFSTPHYGIYGCFL